MIDLRPINRSELRGELKIMSALREAGVPFRVGEVRVNFQKQSPVILVESIAISTKPFSPDIESVLRTNKYKPQVWSKEEQSFRSLGIKMRLRMHK